MTLLGCVLLSALLRVVTSNRPPNTPQEQAE
jgi:hypothetical protein